MAKDPSGNNCTILDVDASRRASLLVAYIHPVCALLAPRRAGASTPRDCARISGRVLSSGTHAPVNKFIAYLALLVAIAAGVTWYQLRGREAVPPIARSVPKAARVDDSWLSDLYSQNPRDTEKGTAKVTALGSKALP